MINSPREDSDETRGNPTGHSNRGEITRWIVKLNWPKHKRTKKNIHRRKEKWFCNTYAQGVELPSRGLNHCAAAGASSVTNYPANEPPWIHFSFGLLVFFCLALPTPPFPLSNTTGYRLTYSKEQTETLINYNNVINFTRPSRKDYWPWRALPEEQKWTFWYYSKTLNFCV